MKTIKVYPKNKEYFIRLKKFGNEIKEICLAEGTEPILYGGLMYFAYTKDKNYKISDLDFLIPENSFEKIIKTLGEKGIKHKYNKKWHTMPIFKGDLRIEIDSIDFWQAKLPKSYTYFNFDGLKLKSMKLNDLIKIYKRASEVSHDKPEQHRKRYEALLKVK